MSILVTPVSGAYYYPQIVKPILPQVIIPPPPTIADWYDSKPLQIIPKTSPFPAIESFYTFAYPNARNDITNQYIETPVVVPKPGAYYYEQQSRPVLPQPFTGQVVSSLPSYYTEAFPTITKPDYSRAVLNILRSLGGLANTQPIDQYQLFDSGVQPQFTISRAAQISSLINAAANIAPITIAPFISSIASYYIEWFPQWQKANQIAQQANLQAIANNIFPLPFTPVTVLMSGWFVDRLPWNPAPPSLTAEAEMVQGGYPPLESIVNPVPVSQFGWQIEPVWLNRYPTWNGLIGQLLSQVPSFPPVIQQPVSFLVSSQDAQPQRSKASQQAIEALYSYIANIFPLPFTPIGAVPAAIFVDPPVQRIDAVKNFVSLILSAVGGAIKGLGGVVPIDRNGWKIQDATPYQYPTPRVALASLLNQLATINPVTIAPFISSIASYFQEWTPQWQRPYALTAAVREVAFIRPTFPIPFVPAPAPSVAGYNLQVWPQLRNPGYISYLLNQVGQVSNLFPIPFIPPPFVSPGCPPPLGFDADTILNYFGGNKNPNQSLFCRTCAGAVMVQSGVFQPNAFQGAAGLLPLLVRGDYAIWCPSCCRFLSKADTFMGTVRAPGYFRNRF